MSASVSYCKVPFFTPIESADHPIAQAADHYLWFGGRVAEAIEPAEYVGPCRVATEVDGRTSLLKTVLKITTMILSAGILPLLALIVKVVARSNHDFTLRTTEPQKVQITKQTNFSLPLYPDGLVVNNSNFDYKIVIAPNDQHPVTIFVYPWDQIQLARHLPNPIKRDTVWSVQVFHQDKLLHKNEKAPAHIQIRLFGLKPSVSVEIHSDEVLLAHLRVQEQSPSGFTDHHVYLLGNAMKNHFENGVSFPQSDVHGSFSNLYCCAKDELITSGKMTFFQMWHALKVLRCEEDDVLLERGAYLTQLSGSIRQLASEI